MLVWVLAQCLRPLWVPKTLESGMTWVNSHNVRDLRTPFGDTHVPRFGA